MKANLIPIILKKSSKFKRFLMQNVKTTRNSLTINPLEEYSITSPTVVSINTLVKQGNYGYIGGDTEYLSYDMALKIAGSSVECPMKVYRMTMNTLLVPSDVNWAEWTDQTSLDRLKTQDSVTVGTSTSTNNYISQIMIELDLTPVANALFGGSNSALKSAIKQISCDVWASGYGSNAGVQTYGVVAQWYGGGWAQFGTNTTSSIAKMTNNTISSALINTSNKINILVASQYASDGTIASSVSLDYINIGIQLTRTPDVVSPTNVSLPKYWGMVGGFSPNWDNTQSLDKEIFTFFKDTNNWIQLYWRQSAKKIVFNCKIVGVLKTDLSSSAFTFNKNQKINFLVVSRSNGRDVYILKNNGTMEKLTDSNIDTQSLQGSLSFYPFVYNNTLQGDMFAESFTLLDLNKLGKANGFSDAEADAILRGTIPNLIGSYNTELFDISKVNLHANASLSGGVITLNATVAWQSSYIYIPVLPNNKYELLSTLTNDARIEIDSYYNNVSVSTGATFKTSPYQFTTGNNVNKIRIYLTNGTIGTHTFSNISLKLKM